MRTPPPRVLVLGIPRSGTTWTAEALSTCEGVDYVFEPDNPDLDPFARFGAAGFASLPAATPGDHLPAFEALWDVAFMGGWPRGTAARRVTQMLVRNRPGMATSGLAAWKGMRRGWAGRPVLVKSVRSIFVAEWLAGRYRPQVVATVRNPLNAVAGWTRLGIRTEAESHPRVEARLAGTGLWPNPWSSPLQRGAWQVCALDAMMRELGRHHPHWTVVNHEDLCLDPRAEFPVLAAAAGLRWTDAGDAYLAAADAEGSGWEVRRRAAQEVHGWQRSLDPGDREAALDVLEAFAEAGLDNGPYARQAIRSRRVCA